MDILSVSSTTVLSTYSTLLTAFVGLGLLKHLCAVLHYLNSLEIIVKLHSLYMQGIRLCENNNLSNCFDCVCQWRGYC